MSRSVEATDDNGSLVLEDRFAIVPEWLLDAEVGDAAVRLYAVLLRYGNSSGARMPSRSTLARRLRKRSTDSVDRAMKELVGIGAVRVEHRYDGSQRLTNAYHLRTSRPVPADAPTPPRTPTRKSAARPGQASRGGRTDAARVAADPGHDPEHLTESTSSSPDRTTKRSSAAAEAVAAECGIEDWSGLVAEIQQVRRRLGASATRWSGPCLSAAAQLAVRGRDWPAALVADALRQVAVDPETRSPMRLAEAGPWWDEAPTEPVIDAEQELAEAQALLDADGARVGLQQDARRQLRAEGLPVTRASLTHRAYQLLIEQTGAA